MLISKGPHRSFRQHQLFYKKIHDVSTHCCPTEVQMDNNPEPDEVSDIKWKNDGHGGSLNGNSVFFKSASPEGSKTFH